MAVATSSIVLPIECLADVTKDHADNWNIVTRGYSKHNENNSVETFDGAPALAVRYPAGSIAPSNAPECPLGGMGFYATVPKVLPGHDVKLSYMLSFDTSCQPGRGGKLPGASSASCCIPLPGSAHAWQHGR